MRQLQPKNLTHRRKQSQSDKRRNYIHQNNEEKEKLYPIPSLLSEQGLSTKAKKCVHLLIFNFFPFIAGQKRISGTRRVTNEQAH